MYELTVSFNMCHDRKTINHQQRNLHSKEKDGIKINDREMSERIMRLQLKLYLFHQVEQKVVDEFMVVTSKQINLITNFK